MWRAGKNASSLWFTANSEKNTIIIVKLKLK
jgi:hypothetical protein